jgi:hypothetical protein
LVVAAYIHYQGFGAYNFTKYLDASLLKVIKLIVFVCLNHFCSDTVEFELPSMISERAKIEDTSAAINIVSFMNAYFECTVVEYKLAAFRFRFISNI